METDVHCITHSRKFPANQGKRQNFDPSILPYKFGLIFMRMKQKKKFLKKKIQNGRFFKMAVFQNRQFSKIFRENFTDQSLSQQDSLTRSPLMQLNLCGCEAVGYRGKKRLKTQKMLFLPVFAFMSQTASRPYRLSYIKGLRINQSY